VEIFQAFQVGPLADASRVAVARMRSCSGWLLEPCQCSIAFPGAHENIRLDQVRRKVRGASWVRCSVHEFQARDPVADARHGAEVVS
jgi:hypothetical protein